MFDYSMCICKQDKIHGELDFETDNLAACFLCSKRKQQRYLNFFVGTQLGLKIFSS